MQMRLFHAFYHIVHWEIKVHFGTTLVDFWVLLSFEQILKCYVARENSNIYVREIILTTLMRLQADNDLTVTCFKLRV